MRGPVCLLLLAMDTLTFPHEICTYIWLLKRNSAINLHKFKYWLEEEIDTHIKNPQKNNKTVC